MSLYMAVTADKYELPCVVTNSAEKLAEICGVNLPYMYKLMKQGREYRKRKVRFIKVVV